MRKKAKKMGAMHAISEANLRREHETRQKMNAIFYIQASLDAKMTRAEAEEAEDRFNKTIGVTGRPSNAAAFRLAGARLKDVLEVLRRAP